MKGPDPKKLPQLLKLVDEESETIRQVIVEKLARFGASLAEELDRIPEGKDPRLILARVRNENYWVYVDCFNGGLFLDEEAVLKNVGAIHEMPLCSPGSIREILRAKVDAETFMSRVLANPAQAYQLQGNTPYSDLMRSLQKVPGGA